MTCSVQKVNCFIRHVLCKKCISQLSHRFLPLLIFLVFLCYLLINISLSSSVKPLKASLVGTNRVHFPGCDKTSSKSAAFTRLRKTLFTAKRQNTNTFCWSVVTILGSRRLVPSFFLIVHQFSNTRPVSQK